ncbi:hypothetical protein BKA69DRAFT_1036541 [Paraphysoderma sedebokerense]|nr:hypothetical protein BKA69DRAFT_1036541 [Paraphysoderma sedebokerense]
MLSNTLRTSIVKSSADLRCISFRYLSSAPGNKKPEITLKTIYVGHMTPAIKILKLFSISTLIPSVIGIPLSTLPQAAGEEISTVALTVASIFSGVSTLFAYKFLKPFVTKIHLQIPSTIPSTDSSEPAQSFNQEPSSTPSSKPQTYPITSNSKLILETLTFFNTPVRTTVSLSDLDFSRKSFMTWQLRQPAQLTAPELKEFDSKYPQKEFMVLLSQAGLSKEMSEIIKVLDKKGSAMRINDVTVNLREDGSGNRN